MTLPSSSPGVARDHSDHKHWNFLPLSTSAAPDAHDIVTNFNNTYTSTFGKFPSLAKLASTGFGRPSRDHVFTSEATFEHVLIMVLKSGFLSKPQMRSLSNVHPLYNHLILSLQRALQTDFRSICEHNTKWQAQEKIPKISYHKFLAASLFYNFHLASIIRFAGGNYVGAHMQADKVLNEIRGIVPHDICVNVEHLLRKGAPHKMNGHSTSENFYTYKRYGNHTSIQLKPEKIAKVMNKEHKHRYAIALPCWIARFVPNLHLTPQGLVVKPGKNDRLIFDASFKPHYNSFNVNMSTNPVTAPPIEYGKKFFMHLVRIWNLRISHPNEDIFLWDDDVSGAFRQGKYNPEIASAFSFVIEKTLWLPCGMVFGGNTSPQCYEPLANAREHLAKHFSSEKFKYLIQKHWNILKNVSFDQENIRCGPRVQARGCSKYTGVFDDTTGTRANTPHHTFVDDNHMADLRRFILQAMAASIEALFRIFGFPAEVIRRVPLSLDKYYHATCSTQKEQLGLLVDTHLMIVKLPSSKREKIFTMLSHWHAGRKSFTVLQAAQLLGSLEHVTTVAPWMRYLFDCLRHSLLVALRTNAEKIYKNTKLRDFLSDASYKGSSYNGLLRKNFAVGVIAKKIWHSKTQHYITKQLGIELTNLRKLFFNENYTFSTPISYLIERTPDFFAQGDACLDGAGGFSLDLQFWWFFPWPQSVLKLTFKYFPTSIRVDKNKFISINLLEYLTIILCYAGAIQALRDSTNKVLPQYPLLGLDSDNTSAVAWTKKAVLSNDIGKGLAQFFCQMLSTNELGLHTRHIAGIKNITADKISRLSTSKISSDFRLILQEHPELRSCRRFHPNPLLLSSLMQMLLHTHKSPVLLPERLGHFTQD